MEIDLDIFNGVGFNFSMCYSMMIKQSRKKISQDWNIDIRETSTEDFDIRVFPHKPYPVLIFNGKNPEMVKMRYSLIPSWSSVEKPKFATYNARIETADSKPSWKISLKSYHCAIPLTSFFESCREGTHKGHIVEFLSKNSVTLAVAGIYNRWENTSNGKRVDSFAALTRSPTDFIKEIGHDRCPIFLNPKKILAWISNQYKNATDAKIFALNHFLEPHLDVKKERALKS